MVEEVYPLHSEQKQKERKEMGSHITSKGTTPMK
jgi:hypothetical protein